MAKRPSLSLHLIVKNEKHNLPRLLASVVDCFDEIHITDTGSNDGTIELVEKYCENENANPANTSVNLHHFKWVDDFAAARNYAFSHGECEYKMWLDGDDVLNNKDAFIAWRDNAMGLSDYWLNTYHYGFQNGKAVCSFMRERVFKWGMGFSWRYFVHEGVVPQSAGANVKVNYASRWAVNHVRTDVDISMDRSRNLRIFEKNKDKLDSRLLYYYGKELFDANQIFDATRVLMDAVTANDLELHDRILGIQYAAYGFITMGQMEKAAQLAHQGLQLDPLRAEYYCILGDVYIKMNQFAKAVPMFWAAINCPYNDASKSGFASMIFSSEVLYTTYPRVQLSRIYANQGRLDEAKKLAKEALDLGDPDGAKLLAELSKLQPLEPTDFTIKNQDKRDDIILTCHPGTNLYEWDEEIAAEKGVGGSETAAIYLCKYLAKHTGRPVKIFNFRKEPKLVNGVEYISNEKIPEYFRNNLPFFHIGWRHSIPVKHVPGIIWAHDLITPGLEQLEFKKMAVLSPFHRDYCNAMQGVPKDMMYMTRNGIEPTRFADRANIAKVPGKVIFSSSPDRGLEHCMKIMDDVIKTNPDATLHVFYGFDNMRKFGHGAQADYLEKMMSERPYVKFHGLVKQADLTRHFCESEVWLYPADFIETSCISALEAACAHAWPVTRSIGALTQTAGQFAERGMGTILDEHPDCNHGLYAKAVVKALTNKSWQKMDVNPEQFSWESVAKEWAKDLGLIKG